MIASKFQVELSDDSDFNANYSKGRLPLSANWQTIWITGASSGIGEALVEELTGSGAQIAISARSGEKLEIMAAKYANITAFPLDVSDDIAVAQCVDEIENALGPIDLVILNAGIGVSGSTAKPQVEIFRTIMETNYLGVTNALSTLVPKMSARGQGHISWVASLAGYNGLPGAAAYNTSKAALISLAEASREELAPLGITLSIINPGFVRTKITAKNKFPMPFLLEPENAATIIIRGLKKGKFEIAFPWQLTWLTKFLRLLPYPVFFWVVRKGVMGKSKNKQ